MKEQSTEFAAVIGLDWADRKHDICVRVPGGKRSNVAWWSTGRWRWRTGSMACASDSVAHQSRW